jgi:hypothetical protein
MYRRKELANQGTRASTVRSEIKYPASASQKWWEVLRGAIGTEGGLELKSQVSTHGTRQLEWKRTWRWWTTGSQLPEGPVSEGKRRPSPKLKALNQCLLILKAKSGTNASQRSVARTAILSLTVRSFRGLTSLGNYVAYSTECD